MLTDSFGRGHSYLRISVTDRCNLRCAYCMPAEGLEWMAKKHILTFEEILRIARIAVELGVRKIRVTGGEPLLRKEIERLFFGLGALPLLQTLAVTTNGVYLREKSADLKKAGVRLVNISLDTLDRERFSRLTLRDEFAQTLDGIHAALEAGFEQVKMNTVVIRGVNDDEILDLVEFVKDKPVNLRFIEFMPFDGNQWKSDAVVPYKEMIARIEERYPLRSLALNDPAQTSKDFSIEGFAGSVSFITSMTDSFCSTCDRLRVTADGYFKPCLFSPKEISLRDAMRAGCTDEDIVNIFLEGLRIKPKDHVEANELATQHNRAMIQIGG